MVQILRRSPQLDGGGGHSLRPSLSSLHFPRATSHVFARPTEDNPGARGELFLLLFFSVSVRRVSDANALQVGP